MTRVRKKRSGNYKNPYGKAKIKLPEDDDNMEGITVLAVFVLFMSCFYILNHFTILDLSAFGLFKVYCFFIGASFLIPIRLYRKSLTMSMYEYIIFNILSIAPLFCSSFFILNDSFSGQPYTETYNVTSAIREDLHTYYILENNQYEDQPLSLIHI